MIITGQVVDENNSPLIGAHIYQSGENGEPNVLGIGASTDTNGYYKLVMLGKYVTYSHIGYAKKVYLKEEAPAIVQLLESREELDEITLTAKRKVNYKPYVVVGSVVLLVLVIFLLRK